MSRDNDKREDQKEPESHLSKAAWWLADILDPNKKDEEKDKERDE